MVVVDRLCSAGYRRRSVVSRRNDRGLPQGARRLSDTPVKWGHILETPEGLEIRVPNIFEELKQRGLVVRNRQSGNWRLTPLIDRLMLPEYASLMEFKHGNLQRILGPELTGPEWVKCWCKGCSRKQSESDKTPLPKHDIYAGALRHRNRQKHNFTPGAPNFGSGAQR